MFKFSTASDHRQRLFDNAWNGLKSQGFRKCHRSNMESSCLYRGSGKSGGCKCAIGWNIPDDKYLVSFDSYGGLPATSEKIMEACGIYNAGKDIREFALKLQECHDYSDSPDDMEDRLRDFAVGGTLVIPESADV